MNKAVVLLPSLTLAQAREWPGEIVVEPSRLAMGIWGEPEGDICAAYCADTLPKIKTFVEQGQLFTNSGGCEDWSDCYPLIPEAEYTGSEPKKYSWEGKSVVHGGRTFILGQKVRFTARERRLEEGIDYLRRMYAHGGYFAAGKTYREVLLDFSEKYQVSQWEKAAIEAELAQPELPLTQTEMLERLGKQGSASDLQGGGDDAMQLTFPGL